MLTVHYQCSKNLASKKQISKLVSEVVTQRAMCASPLNFHRWPLKISSAAQWRPCKTIEKTSRATSLLKPDFSLNKFAGMRTAPHNNAAECRGPVERAPLYSVGPGRSAPASLFFRCCSTLGTLHNSHLHPAQAPAARIQEMY